MKLLLLVLHHLLLQLDEAPDHRTRVILHALLSRLPDEYLNELRVTVIGRGDLELDPPQGAMARAVHRWRDENGEFQAALKKQKDWMASEGMKTITLEGAEREKWVKAAVTEGWKEVLDRSPKHGPMLRKLFTK